MINAFSRRPAWAAYFVFTLVLVLSACEKPEESLGLDLVPEESLLGLRTFTDSTQLSTYTVLADSSRSNELSRSLLGDLTLPDFGASSSTIYTQVRLSALGVDLTGATVDSLVLSLEYLEEDSLYGAEESLVFSVQQLTADLDLDSLYYSNQSTEVSGVELMESTAGITPAPADSVELYGLKYPPQLRLRLDNAFGQSLIDEANSGTSFDDVSDFIDFIKGFRISALKEGATGAILGLDLLAAQSKMTLYYQTSDEDSLSFDFVINSSAQRYLQFTQTYNGAPAQIAFDAGEIQQDPLFISSMSGVNIHVDMPSLITLADTVQGAFNKVELVLPASNSMDSGFFPEQLFAVYTTEDGDVVSIPDIFEGTLHSDGNYNAETGEYRINITRFTQQVVNGVIDIPMPSLQILPASNAITASAVRLNGVREMGGGAKIVVTYTQYE